MIQLYRNAKDFSDLIEPQLRGNSEYRVFTGTISTLAISRSLPEKAKALLEFKNAFIAIQDIVDRQRSFPVTREYRNREGKILDGIIESRRRII